MDILPLRTVKVMVIALGTVNLVDSGSRWRDRSFGSRGLICSADEVDADLLAAGTDGSGSPPGPVDSHPGAVSAG